MVEGEGGGWEWCPEGRLSSQGQRGTGSDASLFTALDHSLRGCFDQPIDGSRSVVTLHLESRRCVCCCCCCWPTPFFTWSLPLNFSPSLCLADSPPHSVSLGSPDSCLPPPPADRQQVLGLGVCVARACVHTHPCTHTHAHTYTVESWRSWCRR